jgi:hypothetical protein
MDFLSRPYDFESTTESNYVKTVTSDEVLCSEFLNAVLAGFNTPRDVVWGLDAILQGFVSAMRNNRGS